MNPAALCDVLGHGLPRGRVILVFRAGETTAVAFVEVSGTSRQLVSWIEEIKARVALSGVVFELSVRGEDAVPMRQGDTTYMRFRIYLAHAELERKAADKEHTDPVCMLSLENQTRLVMLLGVTGFEQSRFQKAEAT